MHWNLVGNAEQWIKVSVDSESKSNKTLSILFAWQVPMVSQVANVHNTNFGNSEASTFALDADA